MVGLITCEQARLIDKFAIEQAGIPSIELMENAGRGCVAEILKRQPAPIALIAAGAGNNGGDGFVIARRLAELGHPTQVVLVGSRTRFSKDTLANYERAQSAGVSIVELASLESLVPFEIEGQVPTLFVDALLGTGARGAPRNGMADLIRLANDGEWLRIAIDVPSGLDADTGAARSPTFRADLTCTFIGKKIGFGVGSAKDFLGEVVVVPIGIPDSVIAVALD